MPHCSLSIPFPLLLFELHTYTHTYISLHTQAGVAAIALGALDKHDINVPIVPVGLTYFRGHRFRGRLVVEFGQPIYVSKSVSNTYSKSKRLAYGALLEQVASGMRSVIVTAPDYTSLKLIHTFRRLYQRSSTSMSTKVKQDLARRWSAGYRLMKDKYKDESTGEVVFPQDIQVCNMYTHTIIDTIIFTSD
jgi:hypothetical protein